MTHPTDEEHVYLHPGYKKPYPIETVLRDLAAQEGCDGEPYDAMVFAADTITTLRAQLAEARTELVRRVDMHECAMAERDDATLYSDEQKARADHAEASLAAQIEADAGICDKHSYSNNQYVSMRMIDAAREIRNQPHDRTALDRLLADAEANALRRAAKACDWGDIYGENAVNCILALIPKEGKQ